MTELPQYMPKTECKNCIFGTYVGEIQKGCSLDRLKKLEDNGAVVIRPDGEKNFYTIERRNCSSHRDIRWSNGKDKSILDIIVRAELLIKPESIIVFDDKYCIEDLKITINSLVNQLLQPSKIIVISNQDKYKPSELVKLLQEQPLAYRLDNILRKKGFDNRTETIFHFDDTKKN